MKNKTLIVANWKMNPLTVKEAERIVKSLDQGIKKMNKKDFNQKIELTICPPSIFLGRLGRGNFFNWGIQNIFWETRGAFTGETSARMAEDAGCKHVIVGHSERRGQLKENDAMVNLKMRAALQGSLYPILCVGETKEAREKNQTNSVVRDQLIRAFQQISILSLPRITIAYEPVWAISNMEKTDSFQADSPDDVMGITILIRKILAKMYRSNVIEKVKIIYGGSVNQKNIDQFLDVDIIDGFLIGGASLSMFDFLPIIKKAYERTHNV